MSEQNNDMNNLSGFFFSNTFKDTIRTMTGLEMAEEKVSTEELIAFKAQITGVIVLTGNKNIMLALSLSQDSAYILTSFMTGTQCNELSPEDLSDGISEIANVVAGKIKAKLATNGVYLNILIPFTIRGNDHFIAQRKDVLLFVKKFHVDSVEVLAKAYLL